MLDEALYLWTLTNQKPQLLLKWPITNSSYKKKKEKKKDGK